MTADKLTKAVLIGAGDRGREAYYQTSGRNPSALDRWDIVAVADSNAALWGKKFFDVPIIPHEDILNFEFDILVITVSDFNLKVEILLSLLAKGIERNRIIFRSPNVIEHVRYDFVKKMCDLMTHDIQGNVAECGVFRGGFACRLNQLFYDRKLYLFDTFEGFTETDILANVESGFPRHGIGHFSGTSVELVMAKMPYPDNVIIKKGWVPDTFAGIDDRFCFVNLDMDLYPPMLAAIQFFYERMVPGGVMLLHDYYDRQHPGIKIAVAELEAEKGLLHKGPIGDGSSIAIYI
ncbi:class I SAM-dependent methyltransferase [Christensenellaceae bacterium OttesenSCG-928-M15]|nr:class I SAM-dependent methyltransferase [Christensenellaceae bacterium OttesenSCG-928-M15]